MRAMRMSLAFLTSLLAFSCAHDEPTLRMMSDRAEYGDEAPETSDLNLGASGALGEVGQLAPRAEPRVAQVWVYPQRLSNREHFWGAWISLRLEDEHWEARSPEKLEQAPPAARPKDDGKAPSHREKKKLPRS